MRESPRRPMTVHRNRAGQRPRTLDQGQQFDPAVTITIVQIVVCMILVAGVFTFQFFDKQRFEQLGTYYKAVMGEQVGEAVFVGAFGTPIDFDTIQEYIEDYMANTRELPQSSGQGGMGGESPYIPSNIYTGPVLFTTTARYPAYGSVTSGFGLRTHPITGKPDFHTGMDVAAWEGDSIFTIYSGTVEEVGESNIYGNYIKIRHSPRLVTVYSHCSKILATQGSVVRAGERVAEVGSTGVSTGPHVHLDVLVDGKYINPARLYTP